MAKESSVAKTLKEIITAADHLASSAKKLIEQIKPETPPDDQENKDEHKC